MVMPHSPRPPSHGTNCCLHMKEEKNRQNPQTEQSIMENASPLISWSIKAVDMPPNTRKISILVSFSASIIFTIMALRSFYNGSLEDFKLDIILIPPSLVIGFIFTAISRQKTVFDYRIYAKHGECDSCLYFPKYSGTLFKSIAILSILILSGVALYTSSWLILILGPIFILAGSGGALLSWTPPTPKLETSLPWSEYRYVTVDRKYRIIVTHRSDMTLGFEARFPDKVRFEEYLEFLHRVLPSTVQYKSEVWKW